MSLNIKNAETHRLVLELAHLTGESQTEAVTQAVQERLSRLRGGPTLSERLVQIGKDCAARLPEAVRALDHGDYLYGEDGLPK